MEIIPLKKYVTIRPEEKKNETETGIILTEEKNELWKIGEVLMTGLDVDSVHSGDRVIYRAFGPDTIDGVVVALDTDIVARIV